MGTHLRTPARSPARGAGPPPPPRAKTASRRLLLTSREFNLVNGSPPGPAGTCY